MKEDFITYEQAVKLKELGFDWGCDHYYHLYDEQSTLSALPKFENFNKFDKNWSAPTLAQAQKWLREVKETEVIVIRIDEDIYSYMIYGELVNVSSKTHFNFYEQALSAGIDRALELLKQENK